MALKYKTAIFMLYTVSVVGCHTLASNAINRKPTISSEFEVVIENNNNHSLFCQGSRSLKWTTPLLNNSESWTTFNIVSVNPRDPAYQYGSILHIFNMTYLFVGFYYCHYEDVGRKDEYESSSVYLYVNDNKHLAVLDKKEKTVYTTRGQETVIPCRPTSPNVHVTLKLVSGAHVPMDDMSQFVYHYDRMYGFFTNDTKEMQTKYFRCDFRKYNIYETILVDLVIETPVGQLEEPHLRDLNKGHTVVGNKLTLICEAKTINDINFHWTTPNGPINRKRARSVSQRISAIGQHTNMLEVYNVTLNDKGKYVCAIKDTQGHSSYAALDVQIYDINEHFLNLSENSHIIASAGEEYVLWSVDVQGHPAPKVNWMNNANGAIHTGNTTKYEAKFNTSTNKASLKIKNITISDEGNYTLVAINKDTKKSSLFLRVTDKPSIRIQIEPLYLINTPRTIKCIVHANPEPNFRCKYKACRTYDCDFMPVNATVLERRTKSFEYSYNITINVSQSGSIKCFANNSKGYDKSISGIFATDVKNGFDILVFGNAVYPQSDEKQMKVTVPLGEPITAICGASVYIYSDIRWIHNGQILTDDDGYKISKNYTEFSNRIELKILQANYSDKGLYSCRVTTKKGEYLYKNMSLFVADLVEPRFNLTNMTQQMEMNVPDKLIMNCQVFGVPKPTITWYKDAKVFKPSEPERIKVDDYNEIIIFSYTERNDEGIYKCVARNKVGEASKQQTIKFKNSTRHMMWFIIVVASLSFLFIGAMVFIAIKIRKEKELQRELNKFDFVAFEKGAVENINPELGIDSQVELLPYDRKWEFPMENLKLGMQLGSGAYGVVMKGEAKNIVKGEDVTTVAVKMVKKNADHMCVKALASELKIMVHLGQHLNVVNLLGACTKNVAKRELLVIVEFCRFGNLQNYLLRNRENFINQVDTETRNINFTIGQEYCAYSYSVSIDKNTQSKSSQYIPLSFLNDNGNPILPPANTVEYYKENIYTEGSETTGETTIPRGIKGSNDSLKTVVRPNFKGSHKNIIKPIFTKDLLVWAFQVARGMEYLASRRVLHGDLAARNILLADGNIVKICDFGLARNMYKDNIYKKGGQDLLPLKWMALESITDRIFSTQSDVWSFIIVLWEFFSLARTPYPGIEADERLYHKLLDGYRMEPPEFAPKEIHRMMTSCWRSKPLSRPSFTDLADNIGNLLETGLRAHYVNLNDPYMELNRKRIDSGESDYLKMVSPPIFALSGPRYVSKLNVEQSDYLIMESSNVFSPRIEEDEVFDFIVDKKKHHKPEDGNEQEIVSILGQRSELNDDASIPNPSTSTPKSFSNVTYSILLNTSWKG